MNAFGLSRNQRAQGTELAIIASNSPKFTDCDDYLSKCLAEPAVKVFVMNNDTNTHYFCGELRLVQQEPVKFAYRDEVPEMVRAVSYVDLDIRCPRP